MKSSVVGDWLLRFLKGSIIGTGFILPGVSGGVLAAILGLYERIISFLAHLTRDFVKNVLYFIPVGLGMLTGIVVLSYPLGFFLESYPSQTMWAFIGCILGTLPFLWKRGGRNGRRAEHILIMLIALVGGTLFLRIGADAFNGQVPQNPGTWFLAGVIIAMGVLVPGMSPSSFLLYMGMYGDLVKAFKSLDLTVLIPVALGGFLCMLALSKFFEWLFIVAYGGMFHFILGVVSASALAIIPLDFPYLGLGGLACLLACIAGILLGRWMCRLEEKYKPES